MGKIFKTATAFRKSLESRLMNISQETNIDLQRLRRKVAFDRLTVVDLTGIAIQDLQIAITTYETLLKMHT